MSGPFKMKGSPMKRNFGIGVSPTKQNSEKIGPAESPEAIKAKKAKLTKTSRQLSQTVLNPFAPASHQSPERKALSGKEEQEWREHFEAKKYVKNTPKPSPPKGPVTNKRIKEISIDKAEKTIKEARKKYGDYKK